MNEQSPRFEQQLSADVLYRNGNTFLEQSEYRQAIECFSALLMHDENNPDVLGRLAMCLSTVGKPDEALTFFRRASKWAPDNVLWLEGIGNCYNAQGNFDKAETSYRKALQKDPNWVMCLYNMILVRSYPLNSREADELRRIYRLPSLENSQRALTCFALGKLYEDNGDIKKAFGYYEEGNRLEFATRKYDEAKTFTAFDMPQTTFSAKFLELMQGKGRSNAAPIFVLGMPRSGTSLVEQILASHSGVAGAGEIDFISRIVRQVIPPIVKLPYPTALPLLTPENWQKVAETYLNHLESYCEDKTLQVIDKTPGNFFYIGLIHLLFPNARIIHCVRDPMDTCWSMYRQRFNGAVHYCYDQTALGKYYCRYFQLMRHWHTVLPHRVHDVRYEQLIREPETVIRGLLEYCKLGWEENCMAFYRTKRNVSTHSMRQVRMPLYSKAIKSWEPVAQELAPLRTALQPCYEGKA